MVGDEYPLTPSSPDDGAEIETSIFNERTVYPNCTVEVWRNSVTGEVSVGWYRNDDGKLMGMITQEEEDEDV